MIALADLRDYWNGKTADALAESLQDLDDSYWGGVCDEFEWERVRGVMLALLSEKLKDAKQRTEMSHENFL